MDGAFACPECGCTVEVRGLSPGRQTRCEFCDRLVEIPFIPRVVDSSWRRRRFRRSPWLVATWTGVGLVFIAIVLGGISRFISHRGRAERRETIEKLIRSSTQQSQAGAFGLALVDLDAAIELLGSMDPIDSETKLDELKRTRGETARRDAEKILAELAGRDDILRASGAWLSLRTRIAKDPDLAVLKGKLESEFRTHLEKRLESEHQTARSALESRNYEQALELCLRLDREFKLLPPDVAESWRRRLEEIVGAIVHGPGVIVTLSEGPSSEGLGQKPYISGLVATATRVLREKGYIPPPADVPWKSLWGQAHFLLNLEVSERREGNYQASQNRLTRIEVNLVLSREDIPLWKVTTVSRSHVPLPNIPATFSNQLAVSPARIDEFEELLHEDARSMIDGRLTEAIKGLPAFASDPAAVRRPG